MQIHQDEFFFSDYHKNYHIYSEKHKNTIGKFKDSNNGKTVFEFAHLKVKMYSILSEDGKKKSAKEIPTSIVRKKTKHSKYSIYLHHRKTLFTINNIIQQDHYESFTIKYQKLALSSFYYKR